MVERFEKYGVLVKKTEQWERALFGFNPLRIGDCISDMGWLACYDPEYTKYIPICAKLLKEGKRWPDEFQKEHSDRIAKTKLRYGWSKFWWQNFDWKKRPLRAFFSTITRFFGYHQESRLYRTQHGMTRDPYTHFFAACRINDMWKYAKEVHPPRSIYSPTFWAWQKYLHTRVDWYRIMYVRRELRGTPARQYVKDMALVRAKAVKDYLLYTYIDNLEVKPDKG